MEFLETLFNYEYFGPILFATIAVLTVIFFVILFFGKRDQKEKILEETRKLELAQLNAFKEENKDEISELTAQKEEIKPAVEEPVLEQNNETPELDASNESVPSEEPVKTEEKSPFDTLDEFKEEWKKIETKDAEVNNLIEEKEETKENIPDSSIVENNDIAEVEDQEETELDSPLLDPTMEIPLNLNEFMAEEETKEEKENTPVEENNIDEKIKTKTANFEELANSISKELEDLENLTKTKEETKNSVTESSLNVTPIKEIKKNPDSRDVFSSVFVPKKEEVVEKPKEEEKIFNSEDLASKFNALLEDIKPDEEKMPLPEIEMPKPEESKKDDKIDFSQFVAKQDLGSKPKISLPKKVELPKLDEDNRGFGR